MNIYYKNVHDSKGGKNMNQKINCTVYDCKYCDALKDKCELKQIKVACCKAEDEKESTMCDNYVKTELN